MHITIFVSRWYNEDDYDDQDDYIDDCGTKDDYVDDDDDDFACFSMGLCVVSALCTKLREYEEHLLTISTESDWFFTQPAYHFDEQHSRSADRLEAVQRVNELQQGAQSHKVKHKQHTDGWQVDASNVAAQ